LPKRFSLTDCGRQKGVTDAGQWKKPDPMIRGIQIAG